MSDTGAIDAFIAHWRDTGGSELANTQSFINGLCDLLGVEKPHGSKVDDGANDYVFERRVFQDNGDGTKSFGRIDAYRRNCFILEAKQGSEGDRTAAAKGEDDLDFFGQTAAIRLKRGTAKRGTPGWAKAMVQAKGQAERYAKALPSDHGWPPFLLVADIGYCIEVYADFTGTGKAYAQFPDRTRYRIMLDDLHDADVRDRLRAIWVDPKSLDPTARAAKVTRDIADLLATVARRIEKRGHNADRTSGFLMRVLFTMFAEDSALIPEGSFTELLRNQRAHPEHLEHQLSALWAAMDEGRFSPALGVPLRRFNGYLFKDRTAIALDPEELEVLIKAAEHKWTDVEPAIFGTLLERALDPKERAKLGAHYTPRAYVERLVSPTIIEPLRADWTGVRVAASDLIEQDKVDEARKLVEAFHGKLSATRVLDPACGTGNFLYVAMARMKELEGEVVDLLEQLGDHQYVAELTGHTITPENFLGIEINPRAAAIAQLVLWIGYLQWHFRVNGRDRPPPEPILKDIRTIENRDALIDYDERVLETDEQGAPVTRWDGETMKPHPVTGKLVPDETARMEVYRYIKPRLAIWPSADFIVGNPPFVGNKRMRERLGTGYVDALRTAYSNIPASIDFVMHWWARCSELLARRAISRFGLITTNSISQTQARPVVQRLIDSKKPCSLIFAVADHPWRDTETDAAVRVSMTVAAAGKHMGKVLLISDERPGPEGSLVCDLLETTGVIHSDLSIGPAVTTARPLKSNERLCWQGCKLVGSGFILNDNQHAALRSASNARFLPKYWTGRDITQSPTSKHVVDLFGLSERDAKELVPALYQHVLTHVRPEREQNNDRTFREKWWLFGRPRPDMRSANESLKRYIITSEVAKHRFFQFLDWPTDLVDGSVIAISSQDAFVLGVLSSRIHSTWALEACGRLEDRPRYQNELAFDPYPFPTDVQTALVEKIRERAEGLDTLRRQVLATHVDLTLTRLYNVLEALRAGRPLTDAERDIHDRGLVTIIRQHHDAIDALVAEAYGWPADLSDEDILTRLVALNKERAAEEAKGLIRWLRPDYQAPDYAAPVAQTLDLGEAAVPLPDNVIPWPATLPEQVSAVQTVLAAAAAPLAAQDIARSFKGKRAATVRPVLDALAAIGQARRLEDGRYAA